MESYLKETEKLPLATIRLYAAYHLKFMEKKRRQAKAAYTPEAAQRKREYYLRKRMQKVVITWDLEGPQEETPGGSTEEPGDSAEAPHS